MIPIFQNPMKIIWIKQPPKIALGLKEWILYENTQMNMGLGALYLNIFL